MHHVCVCVCLPFFGWVRFLNPFCACTYREMCRFQYSEGERERESAKERLGEKDREQLIIGLSRVSEFGAHEVGFPSFRLHSLRFEARPHAVTSAPLKLPTANWRGVVSDSLWSQQSDYHSYQETGSASLLPSFQVVVVWFPHPEPKCASFPGLSHEFEEEKEQQAKEE